MSESFYTQETDIPINSKDTVVYMIILKAISNIQIPDHCIATKPIKVTGKCITTTPCILAVEMAKVIPIQNPQLIMISMVHLKDEAEPAQVPLTLINLSYDIM